MSAKSRRVRIREQVLREWRGIDEPLNLNDGIHRPEECLAAILSRFGIQEGLDEEQVKEAWQQLAGDFIAAHSQPDSVRNGQLILRVTQPAMRFHLEQMKPMLLERLKNLLGHDKIRMIRFMHG